MALVLADRVKETTTTTGTGAITLGGAATGFRAFSSVLANADTTFYTISGGSEGEVGLGTYATSGNTLTRTTVYASSNAGSAVNFSAGTKDVFITYPAGRSVNYDASGNVGVGVTAAAKLDVLQNSTDPAVRITQTGTGHALVVEDSTSPDTTPFIITADGRVSHGSNSPWLDTYYAMRGAITTDATDIWGFSFNAVLPSNATTGAYSYFSNPTTATASYTLSSLVHYWAGGYSAGVGSTVTSQYGYGTSTGFNTATTNYSFYAGNTAAITTGKTHYVFYSNVNIATGGGTTWNLYMNGTAPNYIAGRLGIGTTSAASLLDLNGGFSSNITAVSASAIDCSLGNFFTKTASGGLTWTFTNVPASRAFSVILELTNGGTGTQAWPASVKWPNGVAPTLTVSGVDVLGFITDDGGTTWRGVMIMKDSR